MAKDYDVGRGQEKAPRHACYDVEVGRGLPVRFRSQCSCSAVRGFEAHGREFV